MKSLSSGVLVGVVLSVAWINASVASEKDVAALADEVRDKGWIVYSARSPQGDWDLYVMKPDGSSIRNITNSPNFSEAAPRFSHDGKKIIYRQLDPKAEIGHDRYGFQGRCVIADADGKHPQAIGKEGEFPWAIWSPDDKQIACLTPKGILIVNLRDKKVVKKIPRQGMYQQLVWSNDGKSFGGVTNHFGSSWTVARMDIASEKINAVNSFQNCTPDWFPDSKRMIFAHRPGNQEGYGWTQLWMANADGTDRALVFGEDGKHIYGGAISPDNKYTLFTATDADGGGSEKNGAPIFLMRLSNGPAIRGESPALRQIHPDAKEPILLSLPHGWEPHWSAVAAISEMTEKGVK